MDAYIIINSVGNDLTKEALSHEKIELRMNLQ